MRRVNSAGTNCRQGSRLTQYIQRLERFAEMRGVAVIRNSLTPGVWGRIEDQQILLRMGLNPGNEVLTLVHELTHLMVHCHANPRLDRTICEYEAEAVERWVGAELRIPPHAGGFDVRAVTDDLLASSVVRVRWAAPILLKVARGEGNRPAGARLQSQSAVEI